MNAVTQPIMQEFLADEFTYGDDCSFGSFVSFRNGANGKLTLQMGNNVTVMDYVRIIGNGTVIIEDKVTLGYGVSILCNGICTIKQNTQILQYTSIDCQGTMIIGENCYIGPTCQIWSLEGGTTTLQDNVQLRGSFIAVEPGAIVLKDTIVTSNTRIIAEPRGKYV